MTIGQVEGCPPLTAANIDHCQHVCHKWEKTRPDRPAQPTDLQACVDGCRCSDDARLYPCVSAVNLAQLGRAHGMDADALRTRNAGLKTWCAENYAKWQPADEDEVFSAAKLLKKHADVFAGAHGGGP